MITLAVDAMGGDVGLDVTLPGAKSFLEKVSDAHLILVCLLYTSPSPRD